MGSCQNYGPFLGTLNNRCRIIRGTQKGTIILTTTHMDSGVEGLGLRVTDFSDLGVQGLRMFWTRALHRARNPKPLNPKALNPN